MDSGCIKGIREENEILWPWIFSNASCDGLRVSRGQTRNMGAEVLQRVRWDPVWRGLIQISCCDGVGLRSIQWSLYSRYLLLRHTRPPGTLSHPRGRLFFDEILRTLDLHNWRSDITVVIHKIYILFPVFFNLSFCLKTLQHNIPTDW